MDFARQGKKFASKLSSSSKLFEFNKSPQGYFGRQNVHHSLFTILPNPKSTAFWMH